MREQVETLARSVHLRPPDIDRAIRLFSGGNQQKAIICRWLMAEADVLIFDEPTRGIDVGAKSEIYRLIEGSPSKDVRSSSSLPNCRKSCAFSDRCARHAPRRRGGRARIAPKPPKNHHAFGHHRRRQAEPSRMNNASLSPTPPRRRRFCAGWAYALRPRPRHAESGSSSSAPCSACSRTCFSPSAIS